MSADLKSGGDNFQINLTFVIFSQPRQFTFVLKVARRDKYKDASDSFILRRYDTMHDGLTPGKVRSLKLVI